MQIGSNLGNTVQLVDAQVAGGESALDRAGDFMVQQLWARAVEELEKEERVREAGGRIVPSGQSGPRGPKRMLGSNAKTFNEQRANLFKAQEFYDKATS